jgi:hypothetical protein
MMLDPKQNVRRWTRFGPHPCSAVLASGCGAEAEAVYMLPCVTGDEDRLSLLTIPTVHIQLRAAVC